MAWHGHLCAPQADARAGGRAISYEMDDGDLLAPLPLIGPEALAPPALLFWGRARGREREKS